MVSSPCQPARRTRSRRKASRQLDLGGPAKWKEKRIPLAAIHQDRLGSPPEDSLARSIAIHGVLLPVLLDVNGDGSYRVVDGRQRVKASVDAGLGADHGRRQRGATRPGHHPGRYDQAIAALKAEDVGGPD